MQYFKHMSNMRHDTKIRKLINKYGIAGYGWYNLILESITEKLTTDDPHPDLKDSCDDMAEIYNGNTTEINEIVCYMINNELLEVDEISNHVTCHKIYKFLEQSQTRSEEIRELIKEYSKSPDCALSVIVRDKSERIEKNRIEKNIYSKPTILEIQEYCTANNINLDVEYFWNYYEARGWVLSNRQKMKSWKSAIQTWLKNKERYGGSKRIENEDYKPIPKVR